MILENKLATPSLGESGERANPWYSELKDYGSTGVTPSHSSSQKSKNQGMTYIHLTATWLYGHIGRPDAAQVGRRHLCDAALELTRHQLEEVATP